MISLIIHAVLFVPPLQVSFHRLFHTKILTPPPAVIRFRFFAPVPQKKIEPKDAKIITREKASISSKEKQEDQKLQELIKSIESKRKSKALKTLVPPKEIDKNKIKWDYALFIQKVIQRNLTYPEPEKSQNIEESVRVNFCIDRKGNLVEIPFISDIYRSRFENFNKATIDAVMKASQSFPPLPEELEKDRQYFDMVIEFRE